MIKKSYHILQRYAVAKIHVTFVYCVCMYVICLVIIVKKNKTNKKQKTHQPGV